MSGEPTQRVDYRLRGERRHFFFVIFRGRCTIWNARLWARGLALLVEGAVGPDELITRRALRTREFTPTFLTLLPRQRRLRAGGACVSRRSR